MMVEVILIEKKVWLRVDIIVLLFIWLKFGVNR